jgi:hypothetical protein
MDKEFECSLIRLKISQGTLPTINGLLDDVRAPPVPLELVNRSETIW